MATSDSRSDDNATEARLPAWMATDGATTRNRARRSVARMRALTLSRFGDPEALTVVEDAADPVPGTGDVLLRVGAAGYTPTELTWDSTAIDRSGHDRLPSI